MAQELRVLLFTDAEVAQAIGLYLRRQGSPASGIISVLGVHGHPRVRVTYAVGAGEGSVEGALEGEALAGALILHCIERKIPLSQRAQKILHVMEGRPALILNSDFPTAAVVRLFMPQKAA